MNLKMLKKEIETKVAEAQKRARARLLGEKEIDKVISLIKENPEGGIIVADGGAVAKSYSYCAETTKLRVAWFLRKNGVLDYSVSACRDYAREVSYGCGPSVEMKGNREQAWKEINPKKAERLHRIRIHFALRGLPKPPEEIGSVVSRQGDIILARAKRSDFVYFLGTPIGWFRVKYDDARGAKSPWTVLWRLGVRSRKRKWTPEIAEKVAAILTMEVLSR